MMQEPPQLTIRATHAGDTSTLTLTGEIDLVSSTRLNRELDTLLDRVPPPVRLRIDLADVAFMDTTGVAVLLKARRRALELDCRFVVSSTSPTIARLFEITGLAGLLAEGGD
jgi:anti-anti-sigma factor